MYLAGPYIHMELLTPILNLDYNKLKYSRDGLTDEDVQDVSFRALALSAMEFVIQETPNNGALQEELIAHLVSCLEAMRAELSTTKASAIADIVLEKLNNDNGKAFETRYFNPESQTHVPFQFRYMFYEQDALNNNRFRLAPEGYAIYYALNNTIPIEDPTLESEVMGLLLEKGTAAHVLARAKQSKVMAFELYQKIQAMINRAHRNPDKIDWIVDIEPLLKQATELLTNQQMQDTQHLEKARVRLHLSQEEQSSTATAWRQIVDIIEKTALVRMSLYSYILNSYNEYLQAKIQCLEIRPKSVLASLESDILPELLTYTIEDLDALSEAWLPILMPPQRWPLMDLLSMEELLLTEVSQVKTIVVRQEPVLVDPPDQRVYPPVLCERTLTWLDDYTQNKDMFTFSQAMQEFCQMPRTYEEQYFFAWTLFTKFRNPLFNNHQWVSETQKEVWEHDYVCADQITYSRNAIK